MFVLGHALYMRAIHGGKAKNTSTTFPTRAFGGRAQPNVPRLPVDHEIRDIGRFARVPQFLSYVRQVKPTKESGGKILGLPRLPSGERVGEKHAGALPLLERRSDQGRKQTDLQMRDHEGRRKYLETEHALRHRTLGALRRERVRALRLEPFPDYAQGLDDVRAGPAARVEHVHLRIRATVGNAEIGNQRLIHAPHIPPGPRA